MSNENRFYERLMEQIQQRGKTVNQVERELGYSRNALHNYKSTKVPSAMRLLELAEYFHVTPQYLFGMVNEPFDNDIKSLFVQMSIVQKKEMFLLCCEWFASKK